MCGILVSFSKSSAVSEVTFKRALELQKNRGPDVIGHLKISDNLMIGHTRLSIVDPTVASDQPMVSESKNILTFNGEIYNFKELRSDLEKSGLDFYTTGDTEVLLRQLELKETPTTKSLSGMWAFAFYNPNLRRIYASRDRIGKKPLYYYQDDDLLVISSQINSIFEITQAPRILRRENLYYFLNTGNWHNFNSSTLYCGISKVLPGETLSFDLLSLKVAGREQDRLTRSMSFSPSITDLDHDIAKAVNTRLNADTDVGVFVSGGVDSSLVASYAARSERKLHYFTADSGTGLDLPFSKSVSKLLGVTLNTIDVQLDHDTKNRLKRMVEYFEAPFPITGITVGMNRMYQEVSAQNVRVTIDGTGGDEIFGGYFDHHGSSLMRTLLQKKAWGRIVQHVLFGLVFRYPALRYFIEVLSTSEIHQIASDQDLSEMSNKNHINPFVEHPKPNKFLNLSEMQRADLEFGRLQTWLQINDLNSMMYSVESRSPLLDNSLTKYLFADTDYKFRAGFNKYLLRNLLSTKLSRALAWRRDKQGLRLEVNRWARKHREHLLNTVLRSRLFNQIAAEAGAHTNMKTLFNSRRNGILLLRFYMLALLEDAYAISLEKL